MTLFLVELAFTGASEWTNNLEPSSRQWIQESLLALGTLSTLSSLARRLPWQNILIASAFIGVVGAVVTTITGSVAWQPGHLAQHLNAACVAALVWILVLLNCRGVVLLVLRRWRTSAAYGYWLLGGTVIAAMLAFVFWPSMTTFQLSGVRKPAWTPAETLFGYFVAAFITLCLVTPTLINKKPTPPKTNWHPLGIWVALNLWFILHALMEHRRLAFVILSGEILLVGWMCRWTSAAPTEGNLHGASGPQRRAA